MDRGDRVDLREALFQHQTASQRISLLTILVTHTIPGHTWQHLVTILLAHYFDLYLILFRVTFLALFRSLFGTTFVIIVVALWTQPQQLGAVARGQGRGVALVVLGGGDSMALILRQK